MVTRRTSLICRFFSNVRDERLRAKFEEVVGSNFAQRFGSEIQGLELFGPCSSGLRRIADEEVRLRGGTQLILRLRSGCPS